MQAFSDKLNNFVDTISDKINDLTGDNTPTISRADIIAQEEEERSRRINQAASARVSELNANKVSGIFKQASGSWFKGSNAGYKRITLKLEENERSRRLTTKSEGTLRKQNGAKSAGFIKSLGWPFYQSARSTPGAIYIFPDVSEEEREYRLNDAWAQMQAKNNAALISNLIRNEFKLNSSNFGTKRWTRGLEEKERSRRLADKDSLNTSARNAFNTSKIIRNLGWPFFVQESAKVDQTIALEEQERDRRIADRAEQQLARENAGKVFSTLQTFSTPTDIGALEEKEKSRRLNDFGEQRHAMELARLVSGLVQKEGFASDRKAGAKKIAKMIDGLFVPLKTILLLEERERARRIHDYEGQTFARLNAKKVSAMIGSDFGSSRSLNKLEEEERTRRMWDRQLQMVALSNARKVSKLILSNKASGSWGNQKLASRALEEKERDRRMVDRTYQQLARAQGLKLSNMITERSFSMDRDLPFDAVAIPIEPLATPGPLSAPMMSHAALATPIPMAAPATLAPIAPISSLPAPISAAPIAAAPLAAPFAAAPLASPLTAAPFAAPLTSAPLPAPLTSAPLPAPLTAAPLPAPLTAAPLAAPLMSAPVLSQASPVIATSAIPYANTTTFPASGLHLHNLTDAQRKKLEKQAQKHNKKAEKESKKASHDLAKAERLHNKGKDSRAHKLETKAEQHTVAAKHHQLWASDLAKDAVAPVNYTTAYRPAM